MNRLKVTSHVVTCPFSVQVFSILSAQYCDGTYNHLIPNSSLFEINTCFNIHRLHKPLSRGDTLQSIKNTQL